MQQISRHYPKMLKVRCIYMVVLSLFLHAGIAGYGQQMGEPYTAEKAALKESAEKMGRSFTDTNYAAYVKYVHPAIIRLMGGSPKMIAYLRKTMSDMASEGVSFKDVSIGEPMNVFRSGTQLQCIIPQTLFMKVKNGTVEQTSYLLGVSADKGKTWTFIDTSNKTIEQIKAIVPAVNEKIEIPKKSAPVFHAG